MSLELVLFIGLQASGKSSFYRERYAQTHALISKDLYQSARDKNARQLRELERAYEEQRSMVVDNTNVTRADRAVLVQWAKSKDLVVHAFFFTSIVADCVRRNALREGLAKVPPVAIYAAAKRLEKPSLKEGFASLQRVTMREKEGFEVTPWDDATE